MSSVSGPDGGYQYFHRNIDDLEDDYNAQAKKNREGYEADANELEHRYMDALHKQEESLNETVDNVKDNAAEALGWERENNRNQIKELQKQTYDKFGRYDGETKELKQQINRMADDAAIVDAKNSATTEELQKQFAERAEEMARKHDEEMENVVGKTRSSYTENADAARENALSAYAAAQEDSDKRYSDLDVRRLKEMEELRRDSNRAIRTAEEERDKRVRKAQATNDEPLAAKERRALQQQAEDAIRQLEDNQAAETAELREKIKDSTMVQPEYNSGHAQGQADAVAEYEDDNRRTNKSVVDAYEAELKGAKRRAQENEDYMGAKERQALREKENAWQNTFREKVRDEEISRKDLSDHFDRSHKQLEQMYNRDKQLMNEGFDRRFEAAHEEKERQLTNQAAAYQQAMRELSQNDHSEIALLNNRIKSLEGAEGASNVSPAAEEHIKDVYQQAWMKSYGKDMERNRLSEDSLQKEYASRLTDTVEEAKKHQADLTAEQNSERHAERTELMHHIQDVEYQTDQKLNEQEVNHEREKDNLIRNFAQLMERQKRQFDEVIDSSRNDSYAKLQEIRQELNFQLKQAQRASAARENEINREHSRQLADQKVYYENLLSSTKSDLERQLRDLERAQKLELDKKDKLQKQDVERLQEAQKERERYLTQNFEEELDKVRRANALLIQKKS